MVTGTVIDQATDQPMEYATVSLLTSPDSTLVGGNISDADGKFRISAPYGTYMLKVQFVTSVPKIIDNITLSNSQRRVQLGEIMLSQSTKELDEVTVQAERTEMELTLDKKVYNIGKDLSNLGGSAADLLSNLPSLAVDVEGNVSLRGSENVRILINGKPSGLVGLSGSGGLQQLQGNLIERVEVITNPSARYDAEGGAGIINIILKKEKSGGFNGSFQLQTGAPANHGVSANLNYRKGWINWFVNYGVSYRKFPGEGYTDNFYDRADTTYYIDQINDRSRSGLSQNIRFGSDIFFNEKNILTLSASYRNSDDENLTKTFYDYLNAQRVLFGERLRVDNEEEEDLNWQYEVEFTRDFRKEDQKLTFNVQYQDDSEIEISDFDDNTVFTDQTVEELEQRSENDNGERRTLVQMDYVHPFGKSSKFEVGFRYNFRNVFNDYFVESDSTSNGTFEVVPELTNNFNFDEAILASYFIISNKSDKLSWQLGTRLEQTHLETLLEQTNDSNEQDYLSLFPSANITYQYSDISSVQLSYSRRISRPRFRNLNPFLTYRDPLNLYTGNPNLQPQFTDSYELGVLQNKEKSSVYLGVYYRYTDDVVQRIQTEEEGITIRRPENLAQQNDIGLELNVSQEIGKYIRTTGNFNLFNSQTDGQEGLSAEATTFSSRMAGYYRNDKLFNAQISLWYRAPRNTPQGRRFSIASLDVGLSKDILDKNGTIAMNVRDLFNSRKWRSETIEDTFTSNSLFQWRKGPTMTVSFTYRLNQNKRRGRGDRGDQGGEFDEF